MKPTGLLSGLAALATLASASASQSRLRTTAIYIQPILSSSEPAAPIPLATLQYDASPKSPVAAAAAAAAAGRRDSEEDSESQSEVQVLEYEAPELPAGTRLVRVGAWDAAAGSWTSAVSVAGAENFARGYAPTLALTTTTTTVLASPSGDEEEEVVVVGVALKGVAVDAGHTRDFGPKAVLLRAQPGRQVDLGKPVLLGPEGRKVEPEPEKSLLQKYVTPYPPYPPLSFFTIFRGIHSFSLCTERQS